MRVRFLVYNNKEQTATGLESFTQAVRILIDLCQCRVFLIQIGVFGARGDS